MDDPTKGILIYQLPEDLQKDALDLYQIESILNVKHDEKGLQIYFKHYSSAHDIILKKNVVVRRKLFMVYPLVTNLTVHGIRCYADKSTLKKLLNHFGNAIILYVVEDIVQNARYKTVSITDDYRVIFDLPENFANFHLAPIRIPNIDGKFQLSFFCRLCRRDGHKQYQCTIASRNNLSTSKKSFESERKLSVVSELLEYQQNENKGNYLHQYSKLGFHKVSEKVDCSQLTRNEKSNNQCLKDFAPPPKELSKGLSKDLNSSKSNPSSSAKQSRPEKKLSLYKQNDSKKIFPRQNSQNDTDTTEKILACKCSRKRQPRISLITPPNISIQDAKKLIKDINKYKAANLPVDTEQRLRCLLLWNRSQKLSYLGKPEMKMLRIIQRFLDIVQATRPRCSESSGKCRSSSFAGRKQTQSLTRKEETAKDRQTKRTISPGIIEIASSVNGVLESSVLLNFLIQVRGRKKYMDIVKYFTSNTSALINQLNDIIGVYYRSGKKGNQEERDIRWMENLCKRLRNELLPMERQRHVTPKQQNDVMHTLEAEQVSFYERSSFMNPGILEAISKVQGQLNPQLLFNFLSQVRGRKRILEIAEHFTTNTGALADQLRTVIAEYLNSGKRYPRDSRVISYIESLSRRLEEKKCKANHRNIQ